MKVYVVLAGFAYEGDDIMGVFYSLNSAQKFIDSNLTDNLELEGKGKTYYDQIYITEWEVKE